MSRERSSLPPMPFGPPSAPMRSGSGAPPASFSYYGRGPPPPSSVTASASATRPYPPYPAVYASAPAHAAPGVGIRPPPFAPHPGASSSSSARPPPRAQVMYDVGFERGLEAGRREHEEVEAARRAATRPRFQPLGVPVPPLGGGGLPQYRPSGGGGSGSEEEDQSSSSDEEDERSQVVRSSTPSGGDEALEHRSRIEKHRDRRIGADGVSEEHIRLKAASQVTGASGYAVLGSGAASSGSGAPPPPPPPAPTTVSTYTADVTMMPPIHLASSSMSSPVSGSLAGGGGGGAAAAATAVSISIDPATGAVGASVSSADGPLRLAPMIPETEGAFLRIPPRAKGLPEFVFPDIRIARGLAAQHARDLMGNDVDRASRYRKWRESKGLPLPLEPISTETFAAFIVERIQDWADTRKSPEVATMSMILQSITGELLTRNIILPLPPRIYVILSDMEEENALAPSADETISAYRCVMYQSDRNHSSGVLVVRSSLISTAASATTTGPSVEAFVAVINQLVFMSMHMSPALCQQLLEMHTRTAGVHRSNRWRVLESPAAILENARLRRDPFTAGSEEPFPMDVAYVPATQFDIRDRLIRLLVMSRPDDAPHCMLALKGALPAGGATHFGMPPVAPQLFALMILASQPVLKTGTDATALNLATPGNWQRDGTTGEVEYQLLDTRVDPRPGGVMQLSLLRIDDFHRYVQPRYYMVSVQVEYAPDGTYRYVIPEHAEKIPLTNQTAAFMYLTMPVSSGVPSSPAPADAGYRPLGLLPSMPVVHPLSLLLVTLQDLLREPRFSGADALTSHTLTSTSSAQLARDAQFKDVIGQKAAERGLPWYGDAASRRPMLSSGLAPMSLVSSAPSVVATPSASASLAASPAGIGSSVMGFDLGFGGMPVGPSLMACAPAASPTGPTGLSLTLPSSSYLSSSSSSSSSPMSSTSTSAAAASYSGPPDWFAALGIGASTPTYAPSSAAAPILVSPGVSAPGPPSSVSYYYSDGGGGSAAAPPPSTMDHRLLSEWAYHHRSHPLHPSVSSPSL